jgi:tRNA(guanine-26,N2-N2) methyltransferase
MSTKSGQFNYDAITRECPAGFTKITEGTTAVLEPPPKEKASAHPAAADDERAKSGPQHRRRLTRSDEEEEVDDAVPSPQQQQQRQDDQAVFYNPAQVVNRDLSISAIELFSRLRLTEPRRRGGTKEGITILEALSATGLRAIRYYKEITNVRYIIANDMDADAVACIVRNCAYNDVPVKYPTMQENMPASAIELYSDDVDESDVASPSPPVGVKAGGAILPNLDDANDLMFRLAMNANVHPSQRVCLVDVPTAGTDRGEGGPNVRPLLQRELMDVVDLDPYGSASPFLDGAFRCIKEGGLMLVTSTDSAILCGNFADTAHAKYSSLPYKASHCHEAAVRTLLACVERVANKHKKYIVPLLSLHIDFYVRCFFRVYTQPAEVKLSACKLGYQLQCTSCPAFWVRPMAMVRQPRPSRQERRRQKRERNEQQRQAHQSNHANEPHTGMGEGQTATAEDAASSQVSPTAKKRARDTANSCSGSTNGVREQPADEEQQGYRKETFPPIPSRHTSPKLTPLTLQQLPQPHTCPVCGSHVVLSGPLYAAPTQNREFLEQLLGLLQERAAEGRLNAEARITGLVRTALEELPDCPLFYALPDVASHVRVRCPPTPLVVGALARLGYRCSQVHCAAAGLKTDCPPEVLFGILLQWKVLQDAQDAAEDHKDSEDTATLTPATTVRPLLVTPLAEADFTYDKAHDFRGRVIGVAKFVPNAPGWGPRRRHQGAAQVKEEEDEVEGEGEGEGEAP